MTYCIILLETEERKGAWITNRTNLFICATFSQLQTCFTGNSSCSSASTYLPSLDAEELLGSTHLNSSPVPALLNPRRLKDFPTRNNRQSKVIWSPGPPLFPCVTFDHSQSYSDANTSPYSHSQPCPSLDLQHEFTVMLIMIRVIYLAEFLFQINAQWLCMSSNGGHSNGHKVHREPPGRMRSIGNKA